MNARERFLIILLAAVAILMGGYKLLIEPEMSALAVANEELAEAQSRQTEAERRLHRAKTIGGDIQDLEDQILDVSEQFFPPMDSDKIHLFFDDLANKAGISYASLSMTAPVASAIALPAPSSSEITYPAKEAAQQLLSDEETDKETSSSPDKQEGPVDLLETRTVSVQFSGTYAQGLAFLDEIQKSGRTLRISAASLVSSTNSNLLDISISVECYGVLKTTADQLTQDRLPTVSGKSNPFQ